MAVEKLDGFDGTATVKIDGDDYQCVLGGWVANCSKTYFPQPTFCSGKWQDEGVGILSMNGSAVGALTEGEAISDPLLHFEEDAVPLILQATTDSKISCNAHIEATISVATQSPYNLSFTFRSKGSVARTWKTA